MENPFEIIIDKLNNIEKILMKLQGVNSLDVGGISTENEIMNLGQLANYIDLSKSTIYKHTSTRNIPFYKSSKRIYFKKLEIDAWLTKNRISTIDEIEVQATNYIIKKGKVWR
jgi:excisionase family DNA binding protein